MANALRGKAVFGLRTALVAILAIAALLASYRVGHEHGRQRGPIIPTNVRAETIYSREYDVDDIVKSGADAEIVIGSLRQLVEPDSWDVGGGRAEISYNAKSGAFAVSHVWSGHVLVVKYLSLVRELTAHAAKRGRSAKMVNVLDDVKGNW